MDIRIILLTCLIFVGACSSPSDEQAGSKLPVNELEQVPIANSLDVQAEQLRKTSNELQALLDKWERNR